MIEAAIIGAGPYGLSVAAYLRRRGVSFRIFGHLMDTWLRQMPIGMMLKSDGFASNIYDPESRFTLKQFCTERGIEYGDTGIPVRLDTFNAYGVAFKERMVPELEDVLVTGIERSLGGFLLRLENGETVRARRVVLAVGITHFEHVPESLATLPTEFLSHSARHRDLTRFRNQQVLVVGAGASALDLAGLLHQAGAHVQLAARTKELKFHSKPTGRPRPLWQRIRHPQSGLGPGLRSRFFADAPLAFHYLPESLRLAAVRKALGPSGGWFTRDMVLGRVPLLLGYAPQRAEIRGSKVHIRFRTANDDEKEVVAQQVIAATGYKVDLQRLAFLSEEIRSGLRSVRGTPVLSSNLESSVPGLYFVGISAANSFGPVMRFAFGAGFAARHLTTAIVKSLSRQRSSLTAPCLVTDSE